jgi:hypothetical protein
MGTACTPEISGTDVADAAGRSAIEFISASGSAVGWYGASAAIIALAGASIASASAAGAAATGVSAAGGGATLAGGSGAGAGAGVVTGAALPGVFDAGAADLPRPHLKKPAMVDLRSGVRIAPGRRLSEGSRERQGYR